MLSSRVKHACCGGMAMRSLNILAITRRSRTMEFTNIRPFLPASSGIGTRIFRSGECSAYTDQMSPTFTIFSRLSRLLRTPRVGLATFQWSRHCTIPAYSVHPVDSFTKADTVRSVWDRRFRGLASPEHATATHTSRPGLWA